MSFDSCADCRVANFQFLNYLFSVINLIYNGSSLLLHSLVLKLCVTPFSQISRETGIITDLVKTKLDRFNKYSRYFSQKEFHDFQMYHLPRQHTPYYFQIQL
jgi:hypothetical protein